MRKSRKLTHSSATIMTSRPGMRLSSSVSLGALLRQDALHGSSPTSAFLQRLVFSGFLTSILSGKMSDRSIWRRRSRGEMYVSKSARYGIQSRHWAFLVLHCLVSRFLASPLLSQLALLPPTRGLTTLPTMCFKPYPYMNTVVPFNRSWRGSRRVQDAGLSSAGSWVTILI
jgi:hypothetical protein